jgi:hypothetical protein
VERFFVEEAGDVVVREMVGYESAEERTGAGADDLDDLVRLAVPADADAFFFERLDDAEVVPKRLRGAAAADERYPLLPAEIDYFLFISRALRKLVVCCRDSRSPRPRARPPRRKTA